MKKKVVELKNIYVLVNNKLQGSEIKDICVSFDENEIVEYQKRVDGDTTIEKRDYAGGWCDGIKYMNLFLEEIDGELYVKRNISIAESERDNTLSMLKTTYERLTELSKKASEQDIMAYQIVLKDVEKNFDIVKNSKLNILLM